MALISSCDNTVREEIIGIAYIIYPMQDIKRWEVREWTLGEPHSFNFYFIYLFLYWVFFLMLILYK